MKKIVILLAVVAFQMLSSAGSSRAQHYEYGVGIVLGEPTGLNGKLWWNDNVAFDTGLAWSFSGGTEVSIHGDVLIHNWDILRDAFGITGGTELPLYYGLGGRLKTATKSVLGIRFPFGAALVFDGYPFDIFLEVAPIMDVAPKTALRVHGAVGFRFWF